ncbi:Lsr2 family protein [Streptomyces sp. NPDC058469]|uniref:histone-like nucleoid-structuring protein Lsr2 n=1 Tax=Streptomyces sp. NPDC058469 TaxID=3346514 RepID=UPI00365B6D8D
MAKKTVVIDDLDGTDGAETMTFGLDDKRYSIDLGEKNGKKLREFLAKYIEVAEEIEEPAPTMKVTGPRKATSDYDPAAVRQWATENGIEVNLKGRVPEAIISQWRQATAPKEEPESEDKTTPADAEEKATA